MGAETSFVMGAETRGGVNRLIMWILGNFGDKTDKKKLQLWLQFEENCDIVVGMEALLAQLSV
jgi:hypothetical protein